MSLKRVINQARKAGVDATITTPDGTVTLRFGETAAAATTTTELDRWMAKHALQA
jgi:hypothetical protein